ncbi:hypothetical protein N207_04180 [Helicobacter pylori UM114]|uniref:Uncharacterized protein n=1 Tax=Helicobacter pylori UM114 TaxID=1355531 RepID=T0F181_HELPX|nr:hypothetical protein N207_04180 [Helicobacter pylori UM114]
MIIFKKFFFNDYKNGVSITLIYSLRAIVRDYPLYCLILKTPLSVFKQAPPF